MRGFGFRGQATSSTFEGVRPYDFFHHTDGEALLESAELTAVPSSLVYRAGFVGQADVLGALLDGPLEEALAALAGTDSVVLASGGVPADGAELRR